jgi:hypothetical protein
MEANEAPEKIYINSNLENRTWLIGKGDTSFIEYTNTDACIEKVCKWLEKNIAEATGIDSYAITESFKQAMEL